MSQTGGVGPMLGQAHHFLQYAPSKIECAMNLYKNEANRLHGVVDLRRAGPHTDKEREILFGAKQYAKR